MGQPERIGDWVVEKALGAGGMGAVYLCHNRLDAGIRAAVKVMFTHGTGDEKERFLREIRTLFQLKHPAVIKLAGFGEGPGEGELWMAMELVEGEDFEDVLARGAFPAARAVELFETLADGLVHCHDRGLFHRDLKPGNIMLGADEHPVLIDFGISLDTQRKTRLTSADMAVGTPEYMPPEVFGGEAEPSPALADVYALGLVLYEVLTGRRAFQRPTNAHPLRWFVKAKVSSRPFDPGESFEPRLRQLVRDATQPDPDDRLDDMTAFRDRLRQLGEVATAPAPSPPAEAERPAPPPTTRPMVRAGRRSSPGWQVSCWWEGWCS